MNRKATSIIVVASFLVISVSTLFLDKTQSLLTKAEPTQKTIVFDHDTNCPAGLYSETYGYSANDFSNKGEYDVETMMGAFRPSTDEMINFTLGGDHFMAASANFEAYMAVMFGVNAPTSLTVDFGGSGYEFISGYVYLMDVTGMYYLYGFELESLIEYDLTGYEDVRAIGIYIGAIPIDENAYSIHIDSIQSSWSC